MRGGKPGHEATPIWTHEIGYTVHIDSPASRAEIEQGMAGMNPVFYQRMLKELTEQIKLGDELGYDSVSFTEHHFHIEGFELSNNPVLLDLYFAMQTKRIRVGQLGIVLPALFLNYLGQGALLLDDPRPEVAANPFFRLAPTWALYPLVALSTAAACIASQAIISGWTAYRRGKSRVARSNSAAAGSVSRSPNVRFITGKMQPRL